MNTGTNIAKSPENPPARDNKGMNAPREAAADSAVGSVYRVVAILR
jgi:hypothetical protein